jgi:hypothetical protein
MHRLAPDFIVERLAAGEMSGGFPAVGLFVDISGFSTLTDGLMAHGQHGAEVLATIMRAVFEPLLQSVYEQGGLIVTFAGDPFTALFPLDGPRVQGQQRALAAAWAIQERMAAVAEQATPDGTFTLAVKVGVADGGVDWGIVISNPFFAEQILRYPQERDLLALGEGGWQIAHESEALLLPTDVRAVLVARLDQLALQVKEVVQTASVLEQAYAKLREQASNIPDPAVRQSFLRNVPHHR